ncbi:hypothetical protein KDL01_01335 [Actinospica durhamensis]|uniref:Glycosyltransferase n=1 Tax=Actinospica durhamensis TaxID=1508375 RepID=A0A941IR31_9ACTN|nr:hypothetical protein [Actinospica durhamensis]MBR7831881.1 hypothetical protein [Actinospica durhamensis]
MIHDDAVTVSVAVMTHPRRLAAAERLAAHHPELGLEIVVDPEPESGTSLSAALAAWSRADPTATHHLVLQDDVILCENFAEQLLYAVRSHPAAAISLFAEWGSRSATTVRLAAVRGQNAALAADPFTPTQALVLPTEWAAKFAAESVGEHGPDDVVMRRFLGTHKVPSIVTAPNLVDHDDRPSLTGNGFQGPRRSVWFAAHADLRAGAGGIAGDDLDQLPHVDWWRLVAEWFRCDPASEPGWFGAPLAERLPPELSAEVLHARYTEDLRRIDRDGALRETLTDIVLFELWRGYFALGLGAHTDPDLVAERLSAPGRSALATAFPGALRRCLAPETLDRLTPAGTELVIAAVLSAVRDTTAS